VGFYFNITTGGVDFTQKFCYPILPQSADMKSWRIAMKSTFALLLIVGYVLGAQDITPPLAKAAEKKISDIMLTHPDPLVSRDLANWVREGRVVFALNNLFPGLSSSAERTPKGEQIRLWYDPFLILNPMFTNEPAEKLPYLQLELYHEAVYISEHIHGRYKLQAMNDRSRGEPEAEAEKLWKIEWTVMQGKWALAKKLKVPHLLPAIYQATRVSDNPRSFLEGFYNLRMQNEARVNPALGPYFTAIYAREKAKISAVYK